MNARRLPAVDPNSALVVGDVIESAFARGRSGARTVLGPVTAPDANPLQVPGRHRLVYQEDVGGPAAATDQRLYLDRATIERWRDMAASSATGRIVLDMAGVRTRLFEAPDGHRYAVWTLLGRLKPESVVG